MSPDRKPPGGHSAVCKTAQPSLHLAVLILKVIIVLPGLPGCR